MPVTSATTFISPADMHRYKPRRRSFRRRLSTAARKRRRTLFSAAMLATLAGVHFWFLAPDGPDGPRVLRLLLCLLLAFCLGLRLRWARWVAVGATGSTLIWSGYFALKAIAAGTVDMPRLLSLVAYGLINVALCAYLTMSRGVEREIRRARRS